MSTGLAVDLIRGAIQVAVVVSGPLLVTALVVGLAVSLVQALTQIQEQTLTFIPKLLVMAAVLVVLLPWFMGRLVEYLATVFRSLPSLSA